MRELELIRDPDSSVAPVAAPATTDVPDDNEEVADKLLRMGKEVVKHSRALSNAAVNMIKVRRGMSNMLAGDVPAQAMKAQYKDVRELCSDVMKGIKLDEGMSKFLPAITARLEADLGQAITRAGYKVSDDLVKAVAKDLAEREYKKYDARMYAIRLTVAVRLNEILRRLWSLNHGDVIQPDMYSIKANPGGSGETEDGSAT